MDVWEKEGLVSLSWRAEFAMRSSPPIRLWSSHFLSRVVKSLDFVFGLSESVPACRHYIEIGAG